MIFTLCISQYGMWWNNRKGSLCGQWRPVSACIPATCPDPLFTSLRLLGYCRWYWKRRPWSDFEHAGWCRPWLFEYDTKALFLILHFLSSLNTNQWLEWFLHFVTKTFPFEYGLQSDLDILCSSTYSTVSIHSVSGQWKPRSACANVQADMGLCCPQSA